MTDFFDLAHAHRLIAAWAGARNHTALADYATALATRVATGHETGAQLAAAEHTIAALRDEIAALHLQNTVAPYTFAAFADDAATDLADEYEQLRAALVDVAVRLGQRHEYDPAAGAHHPGCGACTVLEAVPADIAADALLHAARTHQPIPGAPGDQP